MDSNWKYGEVKKGHNNGTETKTKIVRNTIPSAVQRGNVKLYAEWIFKKCL